MKLSKKGEYALRALIDLAMNADRGVAQAHDIARKENIPVKFLEQILLTLKNAGILQSRRGVGGGYSLTRPADQITLGEVIRLIEGPIAPIGCASRTAPERCSCPDEAICGLRSVMLDVRNAISDIVDQITLADVCERTKELQSQKAAVLTYRI
jgi:Rrf2 family protein